MPTETFLIVFSGPPSSGKSTITKQFQKLGFNVRAEVARDYISTLIDKETENLKLYLESAAFTNEVIHRKLENEKSAEKTAEIVIIDSALVCGLPYLKLHKINLEPPLTEQVDQRIITHRYKMVFSFEKLPFVADGVRHENEEQRTFLQEAQLKQYQDLGYDVILVPLICNVRETSIAKRLEFVFSKITGLSLPIQDICIHEPIKLPPKSVSAWPYSSVRSNALPYSAPLTGKNSPSLFSPPHSIHHANQKHVPYHIDLSAY